MQLNVSNYSNINFISYIDQLNQSMPSNYLNQANEHTNEILKKCVDLPIDIQVKLLSYQTNSEDYLTFKNFIKNINAFEANTNNLLFQNKVPVSTLKGATAQEKYWGDLFDKAIQKASEKQKYKVIYLKRNTDSILSKIKLKFYVTIEKIQITVLSIMQHREFAGISLMCLITPVLVILKR